MNHPRQPVRPTIALFIDWLSLQYQQDIWSGVSQAAQAHDINLMTIVGGIIKGPRLTEALRNVVYDLAKPDNVDGVLVSSSSLFTYLSIEERQAFLQKFQQLPLVLIGEQLPGFSSVNVDNANGLRDIIIHLIEKHQCKRLAFIGGPRQNWEANLRLDVFKSVLHKYQLPVEDPLIYYGDFTEKTGVKAVDYFYEQGLISCDAIVCANDGMALGALEALQSRGVFVPDDILLTGFDNSGNSHLSLPAITTVHQPTVAMAYSAAELLFAQMGEDTPVPMVRTLPTKAMIRQSCGCYGITQSTPQIDELFLNTAVAVAPEDFADALIKHRTQIIGEIESTCSRDSFKVHDSAWIKLMYEAFLQSWRTDNPGILLSQLENVSQWMNERGMNIQVLSVCVDVMFRMSKALVAADAIHKKLDDRQLQIRLAIDSLVQRGDLKYRSYIAMQDMRVRELSDRLVSQKDLNSMFSIMQQSLPEMGVSRFFLVLYDQQTMPTHIDELPEWSYLAFAHDEAGAIPPEFQEQRFLTASLLPGDLHLLGQFTTMLLLPLSMEMEHFGYLILEIDELASRYHYDLIRDQVSITLQSLLPKLKLIEDRNQLEAEVTSKAYELALANEQLKAHTAELERRNYELQQFARVARHELQEPLRKIRLFGDRLQSQYQSMLADEGMDYINRLQQTSAVMQGLIDDLLTSTRISNQLSTFNPVDLNWVLGDVVTDLKAEMAAVNGRIQIETLPTIEAIANQMYQLFYKLVHNSLKFHREDIPPLIVIKSQPLNDINMPKKLWEIIVTDNGIGLEQTQCDTLFQPGSTQQQDSGVKNNLAICQQIVALHKGDISVNSQIGEGTTFFITLPGTQK